MLRAARTPASQPLAGGAGRHRRGCPTRSPPVALPTEEQHFATAPLQGPRDAAGFLPNAQLLDPPGTQHALARKYPELPTCRQERAWASAGPKAARAVPGSSCRS